jgi:hypothetical protein
MAADAGIFQQYLNPVRSVADYRGDMDKQEQNALTLAASRLSNQTAQQTMADDQASRQASMESGGDSTKFVNALQKAGLFKQAQAYQKNQFDTQKVQADTGLANAHAGNFTAQTAASSYDLRIKKSDQALKDIAGFKSPDEAIASLQAHIAAGDVDPAKGQMLHASIPRDPAQFPAWQLGMLRNIMTAKEQIALQVPDANSVAGNVQSDTNSKRTAATAAAGQVAENARSAKNRETQLLVSGLDPSGAPSSDVESMAQAIASGKLAPINGFALARPRGQAIMARAMEINPNYDAGDYAAKNNALKGFSTGKEGTALRSFNVATDHLKTLGDMTVALNNGNNQFFNQAANYYAEKTGSPAPTNFDAVKEIVGKEVVKAIVAGGGGVSEREELSNLLGKAKSPAQLNGVIGHFTELMGAQRDGLMDQYQRTTGRTDGAAVFAPSKRAPKASAPADVHAAADAILRGGK